MNPITIRKPFWNFLQRKAELTTAKQDTVHDISEKKKILQLGRLRLF